MSCRRFKKRRDRGRWRRTSFALLVLLGAMRAGAGPYTADLQSLNRARDWVGLEKLSREALSASAIEADSLDGASAENWLAAALFHQGRFPEAEPHFQRALSIREARLPPYDPVLEDTLDGLAKTLFYERQYAKAEPFFQRALVILENNLPAGNTALVGLLRDFAADYDDQAQYVKAEPLLQRALSIQEKTLGPDHACVAVTADDLAFIYFKARDFANAQPLFERWLSLREDVLRPEDPTLVRNVDALAAVYAENGKPAKAAALFERRLARQEQALGPDQPAVLLTVKILAGMYYLSGDYPRAVTLYERIHTTEEQALGEDNIDVAVVSSELANVYDKEGQYAKAELLMQHALSIRQKAFGSESADTAQSLNNLAIIYDEEGQYAKAEPLLVHANTILEHAAGADSPAVARGIDTLAGLYVMERQYAKAEPLFQRALAIREKILGPEHHDSAMTLPELAKTLDVARTVSDLAVLYSLEGQLAEAESFAQRALLIWRTSLGSEHPQMATGLRDLADLYRRERQYAKCEQLLQEALEIRLKTLGPEHPDTAAVREDLGILYAEQDRFDQATANFRIACSARSSILSSHQQLGDQLQKSRSQDRQCSYRYVSSLLAWAEHGGGTAKQDAPLALGLEAFLAAQRAVQSEAGDALAHSAALTAAKSAGIGEAAQAYEAALRDRDHLNEQFAAIAGDPGQDKATARQTLLTAREEASRRIDDLSANLRSSEPKYWAYRAPDPIDIATLQARSGTDSALLHEDEALIAFLIPADATKGVVFAVSKERFACAIVGANATQITQAVQRLRAQIDPRAYGLRGFETSADASLPADSRTAPTFDRQTAYGLYHVLMDTPAIQAVIKDKANLLFVPSGPLSSFPPGLLVTAPPPGGAAKDGDPEALRATPWLLRSKAVAMLPEVASLRTLRQILPAAHVQAADPLLAFADPAFGGTAGADRDNRGVELRSLSAYYRGSVPLQDALKSLPTLPGTRVEADALKTALQAGDDSVLVGIDASKAQLMSRNADGRLAKVRVLEFATHALVAGDASELSEPALVLAAGANPADELLRSSEAATLKLNADWVLLSACNTASPESVGAQGLSGLARAFFFAGAHSLLVSHWRVRDDIAERLIPMILLAERKDRTLTRAQAVRQASLAILDDPKLDAAGPAAWAPFTLIGEPGR